MNDYITVFTTILLPIITFFITKWYDVKRMNQEIVKIKDEMFLKIALQDPDFTRMVIESEKDKLKNELNENKKEHYNSTELLIKSSIFSEISLLLSTVESFWKVCNNSKENIIKLLVCNNLIIHKYCLFEMCKWFDDYFSKCPQKDEECCDNILRNEKIEDIFLEYYIDINSLFLNFYKDTDIYSPQVEEMIRRVMTKFQINYYNSFQKDLRQKIINCGNSKTTKCIKNKVKNLLDIYIVELRNLIEESQLTLMALNGDLKDLEGSDYKILNNDEFEFAIKEFYINKKMILNEKMEISSIIDKKMFI